MRRWPVLLLFVALAMPGCTRGAEDAACVIVLPNAKSGPQAAIGEQITRARTLVEAELPGTGVPIRIQEIDTEGKPTVARAEIERSLTMGRVPIVVGSIFSAETREFLETLLRKNVVVLANGSSDPSIRTLPFRRSKDGFFRNWPADDIEGRIMADYLRTSGRARKLVVLHANDAYATALVQAFTKRFQEVGGEIVAREIYPPTTTSFDSILRRLPTRDHDGYYIVGFPPDLAALYNTIRRIPETSKMPVYSAVGIESGDFGRLVRAELDNLFFTAPAVDESSAHYFAFREAYRKHFNGQSPDIVAAITYDALRMAVDAIRSTACDAAAIRDHLYGIEAFPGVTGLTAFDDFGDVVTKPVAVKYFEHGQLRLAVQSAERK